MAKSAVILVCFLSFLGLAYSHGDRFFVEGKVYCDTCRTQFVTRVSKFLEGATVKLECREREVGGIVTFRKEAVTDKSGTYRVAVDGDHEEEICQMSLVKSSDPDCAEVSTQGYNVNQARVTITANSGIATPVRRANPLGFMKKEPIPECAQVLRELGFTAPGTLA